MNQGFFQVEKLLKSKCNRNTKHYLVKWFGYDESESTWEPESNLLQFCKEMIEKFETQNAENKKVIEKPYHGIEVPTVKGNIDIHIPLCIIRKINTEFYLVSWHPQSNVFIGSSPLHISVIPKAIVDEFNNRVLPTKGLPQKIIPGCIIDFENDQNKVLVFAANHNALAYLTPKKIKTKYFLLLLDYLEQFPIQQL